MTSCITSCFETSADAAAASCVGSNASATSAGVACVDVRPTCSAVAALNLLSAPTGRAQLCSERWYDSAGYETTELASMTATNTLCSGEMLRALC
jgi:hypothetical protein